MKPGVMDLSKWVEKTAQAVRHVCNRKQAPCVGFSLVFFNPLAEPEERWNYVIELAFDPHNPPTQEEQEQLTQAFEFINEGVRRILGGDQEIEDIGDYIREVRWQ
ncbi:MAG: hypothetical protein JSU72_13340 [Deltaproteobacteria bacterium]|nr:MAG: hypothetical protein JSU72_13340 [Deltaproteobacteria bacterium]